MDGKGHAFNESALNGDISGMALLDQELYVTSDVIRLKLLC